MKHLNYRIGLVRLLLVAAFAFAAGSVTAQEITGSIQGTVLTPDGQLAVGVTAVVTDSRDGRSQSVSSDSNGLIAIRSMSPGGPYTVRILGEGYRDLTITDLYTPAAPGPWFRRGGGRRLSSCSAVYQIRGLYQSTRSPYCSHSSSCE